MNWVSVTCNQEAWLVQQHLCSQLFRTDEFTDPFSQYFRWNLSANPTGVFENYHHISSHYHLDVCLLPDLPVPSCALVYSSHKGQSDSLKMAISLIKILPRPFISDPKSLSWPQSPEWFSFFWSFWPHLHYSAPWPCSLSVLASPVFKEHTIDLPTSGPKLPLLGRLFSQRAACLPPLFTQVCAQMSPDQRGLHWLPQWKKQCSCPHFNLYPPYPDPLFYNTYYFLSY